MRFPHLPVQIIVAYGLLLLILIACQPATEVPLSTDADVAAAASSLPQDGQTITTDQDGTAMPYNWIIFSVEQAAQQPYLAALFGDNDAGYWTPSHDDVIQLEALLPGFLQERADYFYFEPPVWEKLDRYRRQYVGLQRDGQMIIYGNFFCSHTNYDWQKEWVWVLDGGECYFQVRYDVQQGAFISLEVNGSA